MVIDAQESFRQRGYFVRCDLAAYITAQNALIDGCVAQGFPVVRVFHVEGSPAAGELMVSGIRTEQCCETTTRLASDLGFQVDYVMDATLTFDMMQPDGSPLGAAEIKARTATVLADRFALIVSVQQALKPLKALQPNQPEADTIDA